MRTPSHGTYRKCSASARAARTSHDPRVCRAIGNVTVWVKKLIMTYTLTIANVHDRLWTFITKHVHSQANFVATTPFTKPWRKSLANPSRTPGRLLGGSARTSVRWTDAPPHTSRTERARHRFAIAYLQDLRFFVFPCGIVRSFHLQFSHGGTIKTAEALKLEYPDGGACLLDGCRESLPCVFFLCFYARNDERS